MTGTGFWWVILSVALYGGLHSALASLTFKGWVERRVGAAAYQRFYRIFFSLNAVVTILPILALIVLLPDRVIYRIPMPWLILSAAIQLACAVCLLVGVMQTGGMRFLGLAQLFDPQGGNRTLPLVTGGFYRAMRHPLYTFSLLFIWLFPWMSWNVLGFNLGATLYLLLGIQLEERKLLREFGPAYAEYQRSTPMLLPGKKAG